jgi:hypothetical protein
MTRTLTLSALALAVTLPATAFAQAAGTSQLAAQLGVDAERYSAAELVSLRAELEDNNREGVNLILRNAGSDLTYDELAAGLRDNGTNPATGVADVLSPEQVAAENDAKAQLAGPLNVDPADFTLNELVALRTEQANGDESAIRAILKDAGVERNVLSVN